jgi:hypothetical protein
LTTGARVRSRIVNPRIDYRLSQIAEDGSVKLASESFLMIANAGAGIPVRALSRGAQPRPEMQSPAHRFRTSKR